MTVCVYVSFNKFSRHVYLGKSSGEYPKMAVKIVIRAFSNYDRHSRNVDSRYFEILTDLIHGSNYQTHEHKVPWATKICIYYLKCTQNMKMIKNSYLKLLKLISYLQSGSKVCTELNQYVPRSIKTCFVSTFLNLMILLFKNIVLKNPRHMNKMLNLLLLAPELWC